MYQIVREIESDNSRLFKEAVVLREAQASNTEFFEGCYLCFDPMTTFGVKKVPMHSGPDGQGLPWVAFKELARALAARELTGHDARDAIELALTVSTQAQWNDWYRRILIKDMRAGFSETTVNKMVLKADKLEYEIPLFEVMLAHDGLKNEKKIKGKKLLEPKLDGVRVITIINMENRTVQQYSRNGQLLENFTHITESLEANIDLFGRSMVLDGEIVSTSFQALMKQVKRKKDVEASDARLMLFDILPLSEFRAGQSVMGQRRRSKLLQSMKPVFDKVGSIDVITQLEVDLDTYVGELQFKEYNLNAIAAKYEGIMIKEVDAVYECKRSTSWLKMKPFIEVSLTAVAVEEGTGKNAGRMGAVLFEGTDDGKFIRVSVGGGWSDEDRDDVWANRDTVIGQIGEVRADAATLNQDSEDVYSLRFPRFKVWRGFKAGEKI
jgi:DNA ligase-1